MVKAHGRNGEVVTVSVHGLPPLMREGLRVAVVPPPLKEERWHTVTSVDNGWGAGQLIGLSGVRDIAAAQALVGKLLLACRDDLPEDVALHDVDALMGREVYEEERDLSGTIDEILVGPANDVWGITMRDERRGVCETYLIPVIDEVIREVPPTGAVRIRIPEGLESEKTWQIEASPETGGRRG